MDRQYGVYDLPPGSTRTYFPSESRPGISSVSEVHHSQLNFPSALHSNGVDSSRFNGYHHRHDAYFPSSSREHHHQERVIVSASAAPPSATQFNSPAHNFTQHLRERSPSSSSALLNLLQRYPSARQNVYSSGGGRVYPADDIAVDRQVFRPADASTGYPLVEVAVPKQTAAEIQRSYPGPPTDHLFSTFSSGYSSNLPAARNGGSPHFSNYSGAEGYGRTFPRSATLRRDFGDHFHNNYTDSGLESSNPLSQRNNWPEALDIDSLLGAGEEDMRRSTAEWKSSFAQMQDRFRQRPIENENSSLLHGFSSSGGGLPPTMLTKSSSHNEIHDRASLLCSAVARAQEAPEFRRSGALDNFWTANVTSRPGSPTVQRGAIPLTAAERLQLLHEPIDGLNPYSTAPRVPQRVGSRNALAARREQYLQEANSPPLTPKDLGAPQPLSPRSIPNFSDLDNAVQELQNGVRQTGYSLGARRLGGCARFPTDESNLSPPRLVNRKYTPSPTDTVSDSSSVYQVPNGLPHPKPKHNVKEQLYHASVHSNFYPHGLRPSPNFPVPSTGSVASRITEFEKRPGTPTLHISNNVKIFESGPMSPRSTVFRSKPVIHVDIGSSHHRPSQQANTVFSFESTPNSDKIDSLTGQFDALHLSTPPRQRQPQLSVQPFDLSASISDTSNTSNDSNGSPLGHSYTANKTLQGLRNENHDIIASPILPKRQQVPPPPKFHFPQGKPVAQADNTAALRRGLEVFRNLPGQVCEYDDMEKLCKVIGIPVYWKKPMFTCMSQYNRPVSITDFTAYWTAMTTVAHDEAARFVYTLTGGMGTELKREHFRPLVFDVILTHPGLAFYRSSVEFHEKYVDVVITRIFWNHVRPWSRHLTSDDLRRADFLEKIRELEQEEDINKNLRYFSYEHFYVIYCLFWEIDHKHLLKITREDLARHMKGAIPRRIVERIFSRAVCRHSSPIEELGLVEFTQFLLADEDKQHLSSIEYWFRVMDEDGDGLITLYDMENYYGGIQQKLTEEGIDYMKFTDVACHLIDAIQPKQSNAFRLSDLKNNRLAPRFFNSFVNWRKFYVQETTEGNEPRVEDENGQELSDWDRFCVEEYEALMDQTDDENIDSYDVNLEDDDDNRAGAIAYNELL